MCKGMSFGISSIAEGTKTRSNPDRLLGGAVIVAVLLAIIAVLTVHSTPRAGTITVGDVRSEVREIAARRAKGVRNVECHQTSVNHWACQVGLTPRIGTAQATWTPSSTVLAVEMSLSR